MFFERFTDILEPCFKYFTLDSFGILETFEVSARMLVVESIDALIRPMAHIEHKSIVNRKVVVMMQYNDVSFTKSKMVCYRRCSKNFLYVE